MDVALFDHGALERVLLSIISTDLGYNKGYDSGKSARNTFWGQMKP